MTKLIYQNGADYLSTTTFKLLIHDIYIIQAITISLRNYQYTICTGSDSKCICTIRESQSIIKNDIELIGELLIQFIECRTIQNFQRIRRWRPCWYNREINKRINFSNYFRNISTIGKYIRQTLLIL